MCLFLEFNVKDYFLDNFVFFVFSIVLGIEYVGNNSLLNLLNKYLLSI